MLRRGQQKNQTRSEPSHTHVKAAKFEGKKKIQRAA